jgi:hypothetical protein
MVAFVPSNNRKRSEGKVTWFKVDDNLALNPKVIMAGNAAMGLWVRAGSWSGQQLTDGFVPDPIINVLTGEGLALADQLVTVGLWYREEDGYQFKDWHEYQPVKEKVLAEREAARERRSGSSPRASRLDADWKPNEELVRWSRTEFPGLDVIAHTDHFVDYWVSKAGAGATKLDWDRTWKNWMRRVFSDSRSRGSRPPATTKAAQNLSVVQVFANAEATDRKELA